MKKPAKKVLSFRLETVRVIKDAEFSDARGGASIIHTDPLRLTCTCPSLIQI